MSPVAELNSVTKSYGATTALENVSFSVEAGESLAVLGPNGAGKTTAINLLTGLRRPDAGHAMLFGGDPTLPSNRSRIGATPQETRFPPTLKVREALELVAAHHTTSHTTGECTKAFGLEKLVERQIGGLSGGQQRRLSVALSFIGNPELVFLDEPTTGLDVAARRGLWDHVRTYADNGGSLLLTTHYLEEAEALADRIIVIDRGVILFEGTVASIRSRLGVRRVELDTDTPAQLPVAPTTVDGTRCIVYVTDSDRFVHDLIHAGVPFSGLEIRGVSLEEAFLALTDG